FKRLGLSAIDEDGDYLQLFEFASGAEQGDGNSLSAVSNGEDVNFEAEVEFRPFPFSLTDETVGDLAFAGYGISLKDSSYDDYAGLEVEGKIVIVLRYHPESGDSESKFARYQSLFYKFRNARDHGAAAMFLVTGTADDSTDKLVKFSYTRYRKSGIVAFTLTRTAVNKLLSPLGKTIDDLQNEINSSGETNSLNIEGVTVTVKADVTPTYSSGANVMALLEGNDPLLKDEVFVIGAHYDHLGIGGRGSRAPDKYGEIHNGADDNASGTAGMLELAEYFSANRDKLRHSILFQAYAAEESGLLGSKHYVENPLIPLEKTYAMLNLDMIGRDTDTSVVMNGFANAEMWDELVDEANEEVGMKIKKSKTGGGSSDHASFNRKGIPNLFFFTGVHEDYHKPTDDWDKVNYEGELRILTLVRNLAWGLDGVDEKPMYVKAEAPAHGGVSGRTSLRVVLGVMPDYAYGEEGLKIESVRAGGSAEKAGIKDGDVIIKMDGKGIMSIEDYMSVLQELKPGDEVKISVKRGEEELELTAKMQSPK
ncbi:MAG: M20/M25/M40 family metallo-hydrolase, partial [Candidatus Marinimicrobia bacterium]|nr:M20/M25/M40 family metallo-hydrolase [Candidatus Neomarinimicrobiota bacterium]